MDRNMPISLTTMQLLLGRVNRHDNVVALVKAEEEYLSRHYLQIC